MSKPVRKSDEMYEIPLQHLISGFHEIKASKGTCSTEAVIAFYAGALIQRIERLVATLEAQNVTPQIAQGAQREYPHTNGVEDSSYQRSALD